MTSEKIRVLVVDDHAVVRSGLKTFIMTFDDLEFAGEASGGQEAIEFCDAHQPDVVLMDLVMPRMDGAEATRVIRERFPAVQVIALTSFREGGLVQEALRAGAISYLLKNVSARRLAGAVRDAHQGRSVLAPEAVQALVQARSEPETPDYDLTKREYEVLKLMVQGMSNSELAGELFISQSTVKFHVSNIISKLEVNSRTEAVAKAFRHNLVE